MDRLDGSGATDYAENWHEEIGVVGVMRNVVLVGAGGVGSYIGGRLARASYNVTLLDGWPAHISRIQEHGLRMVGPGPSAEVEIVRPQALHLNEVHLLERGEVDVVLMCVKSYDTAWATQLITPLLAPGRCVVSIQNGINEETIASIAGWGRTVGCIASTIGVSTPSPGVVMRLAHEGGSAHTVFRVGEVHGRITPRVLSVVEMLGNVDSAAPTSDLWAERWDKLVVNCFINGLSAISGLSTRQLLDRPDVRLVMRRLASEAAAVGTALGYAGSDGKRSIGDAARAAELGDANGAREFEDALDHLSTRVDEKALPSTAQDIAKGRRTEVDSLNGFIVRKAADAGLSAPLHAEVVSLVRVIELKRAAQSVGLLDGLVELVRASGGS
jgi:2-dehydropantoate 2-reductase